MEAQVMQTLMRDFEPKTHMAIIWFDMEDAFDILDSNGEDVVTPEEWEKIALAFSSDKFLGQVSEQLFKELVDNLIRDRKKAKKCK